MKGMKYKSRTSGRLFAFCLLAAALVGSSVYVSSVRVEANHPVLVEGNCDSPVPGTTLVSPGTCGDYDGDGRIGTAEDTDGADRIFGTLNAALGPGTGAAAGTGANFNGTIMIVRSGRFAESLFIGQSGIVVGQGTANPGNVIIEAAPGVQAEIDAVLQGDPAGGNAARQNSVGIFVVYPASPGDRIVTLRNLTIRNWAEGIAGALSSRINIDNCRIEGNQNHGIHLIDNVQVTIANSTVSGNGRRIPVTGPPNPGNGLSLDPANNARVRVFNSTFSHNVGTGILNSSGTASLSLYKVGAYLNGTDTAGNVTIATNPNFAN